jgi:hypothetical protein
MFVGWAWEGRRVDGLVDAAADYSAKLARSVVRNTSVVLTNTCATGAAQCCLDVTVRSVHCEDDVIAARGADCPAAAADHQQLPDSA